jgi:ElaB/YqjD/DUF883 family membrane-anchored ribosome-binding protein
MPTLKAFFDVAKTVVSLGASTNAACRQDIRDVVGRLSDELDRALSLADSYLVGVQYSRDDAERIQYLYDARSKLITSFREHHVCAGLDALADKFAQAFEPTRFSVSIAKMGEITDLINQLKNRERAVLDDFDDMVRQLENYAQVLNSTNPDQRESIKADLAKAIEYHRHEIDQHRKKIRNQRRRIVDTM